MAYQLFARSPDGTPVDGGTRLSRGVAKIARRVLPGRYAGTDDEVSVPVGSDLDSERHRIRHLAGVWGVHPILDEQDLMYQGLEPLKHPTLRDWVERTCGGRAAVRVRQGDEGVELCWIITDDPNCAEVEATRALLALRNWPVEIRPALRRLVGLAKHHDDALTETQVQAKFRELLKIALDRNASDIHLEMREPETARVRFRIDGEMQGIVGADRPRVTVQIVKQLGNYLFARLAKRGSRQFSTTETLNASAQMIVDDQNVALRFATAPEIRGVDIFIRVWRPDERPLQLKDLGYRPEHLRMLNEAVRKPYGVVVLSGPTGSGKSSSLTALLDGFDDAEKRRFKVVSLEEPVERELPHVTHVSVNTLVEHGGWEALLSGLNRWDSNINVLSEIKDRATANAIQDLATAGKLTLTTIHASNVLSIPARMSELGVKNEFIRDPNFLVLLVNQRLVPKLCRKCCVPLGEAALGVAHETDYEELVGEQESAGWADWTERFRILFGGGGGVRLRGRGCEHCNETGVHGRVLVAEAVMVDDESRRFMAEMDWDGWRSALEARGWQSIRDHAMDYILAGTIDPRDVERIVVRLDDRVR